VVDEDDVSASDDELPHADMVADSTTRTTPDHVDRASRRRLVVLRAFISLSVHALLASIRSAKRLFRKSF